ncbi:hypothetical protein [Shewanella chilikensis]|uniref:hypothetical protein n=1 Tax=Shewanella chilikensis TaxID=558541 RepID=UPI001CD7EFCC|nr:hypothetical protein [Shewanella chilikensis]MCA0951149.1 hypothetical protein [Shewanella chilikensis]
MTDSTQTPNKNNHAANVAVLQSDLRLATGYYFHFHLGRPTLPDWYDHNNPNHIAQFQRVTDAIGTLATYAQFLEAGDLESARGQQVTDMLDTAYRGWNASEYTSMPFQEFLERLAQGDVKGVVMDTDLVEAAKAIDYLEQVQGICGYARDPDTLPGKAL